MPSAFTESVIEVIKSIPCGSVATYGQIAELSGNSKASRQVSRILHSCSDKYELPWHRVINSKGRISLKGNGYEFQKKLLSNEGVIVNSKGRIDLNIYMWKPI